MSETPIGSLLGRTKLGKLLSLKNGLSSKGDVELATREERLARRFALRRSLTPPVDVVAVARSLSNFSQERFPVDDVDGLCLDLKKPGVRPTVWINASRPYHRKRFTIAHEIGHIVIPWHTGAIVDDLDAGDSDQDAYRRTERQANKFAAELLMPWQWAEEICGRAEHLRDGMHAIQRIADVSYYAAALRATQVGPPGYLFAAAREGVVEWVGKTRGTRARPPVRGVLIDSIDMPAFNQPEVLSSSAVEYYFWKELPAVSLDADPTEPWRDILERMLTNIPVEERFRTRQRINAIIGNAFGRAPPGSAPDIVYQRALESLQNRSDRDVWLSAALQHPELSRYVLARVHERTAG